MFANVTAALVFFTAAFSAVGCAVPFEGADEGVGTQASAVRGGGTSTFSVTGQVWAECIDTGSASATFWGEIGSSGSTDAVTISYSGAFSASVQLDPSAWTKGKGRDKFSIVKATETVPSGKHELQVCATDSRSTTCTLFAFTAPCG